MKSNKENKKASHNKTNALGNFFNSSNIYPKLSINKPNDKYEQEADAMADQVMKMPESDIQRKCAACAEEEELQTKPMIQKQRIEEEEEMLQTKPEKQDLFGLEEEEETQAKLNGSGGEQATQVSSDTTSDNAATNIPEPVETASETTEAASASTGSSLSWQHAKRFRHDALWYFCGEHPTGFSTTATLEATGASNPNNVEWFVRQGADKVYAPDGWSGSSITLHSSAGSRRAGDVHIEVQEQMPNGTVNSHLGNFTVRKPHRLRQEWTSDNSTCPPWATCSPGCSIFWTEINYRVLDNVGGTIVGATVNENFPNPKVNDQPNNWVGPAVFATVPFWRNTNGTFTDNWFHSCGNPSPVAITHSNAFDAVDHMDHEFYVGSTTPGRGCRVQTHVAQRRRALAEHNNIRTPAP